MSVRPSIRPSVRPSVEHCVGPFQTARGSVCHKTLPSFLQRASRTHFLAGRYLELGRVVYSVDCLGIEARGWQGGEVDERVAGGSVIER